MAGSSGLFDIIILVVIAGAFLVLWPTISGSLNSLGNTNDTAQIGAVQTNQNTKTQTTGTGNTQTTGGNGITATAGGGTSATAGGGKARACAGGHCVSVYGEMDMEFSNVY